MDIIVRLRAGRQAAGAGHHRRAVCPGRASSVAIMPEGRFRGGPDYATPGPAASLVRRLETMTQEPIESRPRTT
jgi:hypothetical protein